MDGASLAGDPGYVDPSSNDFRLSTGSAMIDAGDDASCARTPQGEHCDIGAFETFATGDVVGPETPANLRRTDRIQ